MKTAAVIVNHNNQDDLKKLVSRIREYNIFDGVVIVDNKSDDIDAVEAIASGDKIHLIRAGKNGGYGYGNNIGMKWAFENGFTHAVIANPDTEFSEKCVKAMLDEFSDEKVAVVAPVCRTPKSSYDAPLSGWNLKTWGQELLSKGPICRRVFRGITAAPDFEITNTMSAVIVSELADATASVSVDAVLGSLLAVDAAKFSEVGGYDDEVFLYCEENILGQKMKSHGYQTRLLMKHEYLHDHKPQKPSKQAMKQLIESELYYFEKYLNVSGFRMLVSQIFFDIVYLEISIAQ